MSFCFDARGGGHDDLTQPGSRIQRVRESGLRHRLLVSDFPACAVSVTRWNDKGTVATVAWSYSPFNPGNTAQRWLAYWNLACRSRQLSGPILSGQLFHSRAMRG